MGRVNKYSDELKEKTVCEYQEVGNMAIVARRHEISANTIYAWIKKYRERGTAETLRSTRGLSLCARKIKQHKGTVPLCCACAAWKLIA